MVLVYIFEVDCLRVPVWCVLYIRFKFPNPGIPLQGCFCFGFR